MVNGFSHPLNKGLTAEFAKGNPVLVAAGNVEMGLRSQLERVSDISAFVPREHEFRIYFIGDSITRHGTNQDLLERLKWDHESGMAASSEDKDFVHLVATGISKAVGKKTCIFFGNGGDAANAMKGMADAKTYQPHLVIVQLGEHVPADENSQKTFSEYETLLDGLMALPSKPMIICTGSWSPQKGVSSYQGHEKRVNGIQKDICRGKGVAFADIEKYALDPSCSGTGGSDGVKWHPNDNGQAGYAKEILQLFERRGK
jgi:hypothetical protein